MPPTNTAVRVAGAWLAIASSLLIPAVILHGPLAADLGDQMKKIAHGAMMWSVVHWMSAAALSLFAVTGLIMLASASIPGAFEPQYFDVEVNGEPYQELHVDGGTVSQVFLWGAGVSVQEIVRRQGVAVASRPVRVFVLRNGRFEPEYVDMELYLMWRARGMTVETPGVRP